MYHLKVLPVFLFLLNALAAPKFGPGTGTTVPSIPFGSDSAATTSTSTQLPQATPVGYGLIPANATERITLPNVNVDLWLNFTTVYVLQVPFDNQFHMLKDLICTRFGNTGLAQYNLYGCDYATWMFISYSGGPPCRFTDTIGINVTLTDDVQSQPVPTLGYRKLVSGCCGQPCLL